MCGCSWLWTRMSGYPALLLVAGGGFLRATATRCCRPGRCATQTRSRSVGQQSDRPAAAQLTNTGTTVAATRLQCWPCFTQTDLSLSPARASHLTNNFGPACCLRCASPTGSATTVEDWKFAHRGTVTCKLELGHRHKTASLLGQSASTISNVPVVSRPRKL